MVMLGLLLISGIWDDDPFGDDPVKGVIGGMAAAVFYSSFLIAYRQSNRIAAPAVNAQFDATAGAALGILILELPPTSLGPADRSFHYLAESWLVAISSNILPSNRLDCYYLRSP